jgi:23S rRNA pseudouridine955/2504/2580 synthase
MNEAPKNAVHWLRVGPEEAGQRIDNYLLRQLKGVPKSRIYRLLRKGEVRVNKGRIKPEYRVQSGDEVRIPPVRQAERDPGTPAEGLVNRIEAAILYEDERLLVLNKPAGVAVHGGSGISHGVIEALRAARPTAPMLELVHRLDRDTSGCLVIAKKRSALRNLHQLLREGGMDKRYLALVQGDWPGSTRTVTAPLHKNQLKGGERIVTVDDEGKAARTLFRPLTRFAGATLLDVVLDTGRTHQIRVHGTHIGHPLAGDDKYGDPAFNKAMREQGLRRLFLHAVALGFREPDSDREVHVSAPLPDDLRSVLDRLEAAARPAHQAADAS